MMYKEGEFPGDPSPALIPPPARFPLTQGQSNLQSSEAEKANSEAQ